MWPAILGAVTGIGSGLLNFFGGREENSTNAQLTRETNAQNERLMREQWQREDNAVERRVQDLQNAGLSKTLAAGSPASAGSLASMQKPEYTNPTQSALNTAYQMMSMVQDFEKRANENRLISAQARNVDTKTAGESISNMIKNFNYTEMLPIDKQIKMSIYNKNLLDILNMEYNLENFGTTKGPGTATKPVYDVLNYFLGGPEGNKELKNMFKDIGKGRTQGVADVIKFFRSLI